MSLSVELKKARRRFNVPVAVFIGLIALLWSTISNREDGSFMAMSYAIPLMNSIIMPIGMSILASRIWDVETKGESCKLLFTLQSRESVLQGKAILGCGELLLVSATEGAGIIILGQIYRFSDSLNLSQLVWLMLCTAAVNAMLYFASLWMSIHFNQTTVLAAGMIWSLSGIFSGFLPEIVGLFLPWSYYIPLLGVKQNWNPDTHEIWYTPCSLRFWLLGVTLAIGAVFFALGWKALEKKEV